ncbi:hypothetical protein ACIOUE_00900 [Streptomyces xanthochromogenes]|uniref:hypothetical protein n=1 Tax=Streptomyces xanthochromogenes TaxID=67384 RepID=UPI003817BEB3
MAEYTALAFAAEEEVRAEGMVTRIVAIMAAPGNPSTGSLPQYRDSARQAFETAAAYTGLTLGDGGGA